MSAKLDLYSPTSIKSVTKITVSLPLFGFIFCIVWSFLFNYENSTQTHCEVDNFAPSISAAIGSFLPQKYVWQAAIGLHLGPRFVFVWLYRHFYQNRIAVKTSVIRWLIRSASAFNLLELISLLGLTLVSSLENFDIHKVCFATFGISGLVYFILTYILWTKCGLVLETNEEIYSLKVKKSMLKVFFTCGCLMSYFYYRHNEYCEPYVYSFFCICEYCIVLANMWFHFTAAYDFSHINLIIPSRVVNAKGYLPLSK